MTLFETIVLAIVEGITEFLPVSSTGHMVITQELLGVESSEFVKAFIVNIQFGAILSVVILYRKRFFQSLGFYYKLFVACLPLTIAYLLENLVDRMLGSVVIVAVSLVLGGIVLLFVDNWFRDNEGKETAMTYSKAFKIGLFQIISVIPGVSRSAATIIGGMTQKLDRKSAAEFSFFLAVPTMFAASALKLYESYSSFSAEHIRLLLAGNIVAFVVALLAIKAFITFLTRRGFRIFGWYRIILGGVIILLLAFGYDLSVV